MHIVDRDGERLLTLLQVSGTGTRLEPRWKSLRATLPDDLRGRQVSIELVAIDKGDGATVEAAVDDLRITTG